MVARTDQPSSKSAVAAVSLMAAILGKLPSGSFLIYSWRNLHLDLSELIYIRIDDYCYGFYDTFEFSFWYAPLISLWCMLVLFYAEVGMFDCAPIDLRFLYLKKLSNLA